MDTLRGHPKYYELIDGRRYAKVSPQRTHALLQGWFLTFLTREAKDRGEVGTEWKFYLGGEPGHKDALQPDVSFVSYTRLSGLTRAQMEKPRFAPDVAVEVLSPDDRPGLLKTKIERYLAKGSRLVIVVDPDKRSVRAHTANGIVTFGRGERFVNQEFLWISFPVDELFEAARWRGRKSDQA